MASDSASFTEVDLNVAQQRLLRLASIFTLRFAAAGPGEWDRPHHPNMSLREIAEHVGSAWYAEQVGDLAVREPTFDDRSSVSMSDVDQQRLP